MSVGESPMLYYSIFQQLFKFIPRYRFDKKAEETSGNRCCKHFFRVAAVLVRPLRPNHRQRFSCARSPAA
ncbi:MAG: DUF4372 domain-containing protein [Lentisphaeria bacterium]|nr:DUF4372 domain-containing protein [Lentisphaeria bacterium]MBR2643243.1 DUF4372 domain-containing protein [Lentisphaeria bacterium]